MTHDLFWEIIESTKQQHPDDPEAQVEALVAALKQLPSEEIIEFDKIYDEYRFRAYRWDLWGAIYLLEGGCSDDGFEDFRAWLISHGRETYERVIADPDSLADEHDPDGCFLEEFAYAPNQAYRELTGDDLPDRERQFPEIVGDPWDEEDLDDLFPRIAAVIS